MFWEHLRECVSSIDVEDEVLVMGDMNAKVNNMTVEVLTGGHGVFSIMNGNEQQVGL